MKKTYIVLVLGGALHLNLAAHMRPKCSECEKDSDGQTAQIVVQNVAGILMSAITAVSNPNKPNLVVQGIGGVFAGIAGIVQQTMKDLDLKNVNPDDVAKIVMEKLVAMKVEKQLEDWIKTRAAQQSFARCAARK